ncbi:MAG: hypothetical protein FDZ70_02015 [Actinobacteria bacterium]|nr:MAG: hypothetical protein FDZ70_02015 [Actinomycetota bacterium]
MSETTPTATVVSHVLEVLGAAGVRHALLAVPAGFPDEVPGDIDLVVPGESLPGVAAALRDGLADSGLKVVQVLRHEATAAYVVVGGVLGGAAVAVAFDFCSDYRKCGVHLIDAEELLSSASAGKEAPVVAGAAAFGYRLAKSALKGRLPADVARLRALAADAGPTETEAWCRRLFGDGAGARVAAWLADGGRAPSDEGELRRALLRACRKRRGVRGLADTAAEWRRRALRFLRPTGAVVALLGVDGSGKSTLARRLADGALARAFRGVEYRHLRPGLLGARRSGREAASAPHDQRPYGALAAFAKMLYLLADYRLGGALKDHPARVRSMLVLYDRHAADLALDPRRYRTRGPWAGRLLSALVRRPDVTLLADVEPHVALARKSEVAEDELRRSCAVYRAWAAEGNAVRIDANGEVPEAAAADAVMRAMSEREWMYQW